MLDTDIKRLTAQEFCDNHGLDSDEFFLITHNYPALLPESFLVAGKLRFLEDPGIDGATFRSLVPTSPAVKAGVPTLPARVFCSRYGIRIDDLFVLHSKSGLPPVYSEFARLVFREDDLPRWERKQCLPQLMGVQS